MKKLLLITGDLATGKSTFGRMLAKRYACTMLCKDGIKELLADTVGFSSREENRRLSIAAVETMIHFFSEMTVSSSDIILEANFRAEEMKRIYKIACEAGYRMLTLELRADVDILYQRFINRIKNENRHPAHVSGFSGYEDFCSYVLRMRNERSCGEVVEICANDFTYISDEVVLKKIDQF